MLKSILVDSIKSQEEADDGLSEIELNELDGQEEKSRNTTASNVKNNEQADESQTFEKLEKSIDFVLVSEAKENDEQNDEIRATFEMNLRAQGLELETEEEANLKFVKIHIPRPILRKYCDSLRLKMPMKQVEIQYTTAEEKRHHDFYLLTEVKSVFQRFIGFFNTIVDPHKYRDCDTYTLYAEYSMNKSYMFDDNNPSFFTPIARMLVADFILHRTKWTKNDEDVGIQTLLDNSSYEAAYPLHDGACDQEGTRRKQLLIEWASLDKWIRLQPIDDVKEYLGVKFAFYFAWLGFYTKLLIPASVLGILVFLYGFMSLSQDEFSSFVCSDNGSTVVICPLCDINCSARKLNEICLYAKITYLFSNNFTVVFVFIMSVWATFFLELWKQHAAVLSHCWGLSDYSPQSEHSRPQFVAKWGGGKKKLNVREPVLSFWFHKLPTVIFSYTIVIFFMLIAVNVVLSIVLLQMWMYTTAALVGEKYSSVVVPVTSGLLNLISITILNATYENIANYLTSLELPRTQTEFENSLSIKLYIFQFVNYYSSVLYIAFFKGKFVGYPGNYNRIFELRQEECHAGGCLLELSIQLAIIMGGKKIIETVLEMVIPAGSKWFKQYKLKKNANQKDLMGKQWYDDYNLRDWGTQGLFSEYLEMAIQFGFVTLFASAFPLASLFALLNNILELRLDAHKILKYYRRPVPHPVPNIGVWYRITDVIGKMAVIFNAIIIAFSSDFIPRLVQAFESDGVVSNFDPQNKKLVNFRFSKYSYINEANTTQECWYRTAYSEPPSLDGQSTNKEYDLKLLFWKILAARLLFIFIFQNTVFMVKTALQWLIPDVPAKLKERKKKEAQLITELMIRRETEMVLRKANS